MIVEEKNVSIPQMSTTSQQGQVLWKYENWQRCEIQFAEMRNTIGGDEKYDWQR